MKKLFTLCASALLAFTLSAQADQAKGSMYLGITDATAMFDAFGDDNDMNLTFTAGYAVQDGLVVMISSGQDSRYVVTTPYAAEVVEVVEVTDSLGNVTTPGVPGSPEVLEEGEDQDYEKRTFGLHIRYFKNGYYGQVNLNDFNDATDADEKMTLSVGAMYNLDVVDGLYIDPSMTLGQGEGDEGVDMSFNIGLGMKF